ncbi:hypothetical protein XELAEV_18010597mg [Xenopus laevis]|uniref:Uncharacterized protein n=1 Tax=Xenopus laevis TaxID=8355 RepID=A0A974DVS0_XENLA|nr:hypothetical protein XELAEV_18010597mg [Xenopus laevis]
MPVWREQKTLVFCQRYRLILAHCNALLLTSTRLEAAISKFIQNNKFKFRCGTGAVCVIQLMNPFFENL